MKIFRNNSHLITYKLEKTFRNFININININSEIPGCFPSTYS